MDDKFLAAQLNAIEKDIYLESEKAKKNLRYDEDGKPSQETILKWIEKYAECFRNAWHKSICKECQKIFTCNNCLKEKCELFT
jgi:hypothetical protein